MWSFQSSFFKACCTLLALFSDYGVYADFVLQDIIINCYHKSELLH